LYNNYKADFGLDVSKEDLAHFVKITWFRTVVSWAIDPAITYLVSDIDDLQILQDAVNVQADFLITKNLRDFDVVGIYDALSIQIVNAIPDSILESIL
jgi:hypothetical protein